MFTCKLQSFFAKTFLMNPKMYIKIIQHRGEGERIRSREDRDAFSFGFGAHEK